MGFRPFLGTDKDEGMGCRLVKESRQVGEKNYRKVKSRGEVGVTVSKPNRSFGKNSFNVIFRRSVSGTGTTVEGERGYTGSVTIVH